MIIEFRVQNFRSFRKEQTLSFVASNYDKSLPENIITPELPGVPDLRLVKAVALYGPNAGGKTNVLKALAFLRWLVVESANNLKPDAKLPVDHFALDKESSGQPTTLNLTFVIGNVRYELAVAVSKKRVLQERLVAYPSGRAQIWYDRVWKEETKAYEWSGDASADFKRDPGIVEKTRPNALFLSTAAQWNNAQVAPVYSWFVNQLRFLNWGLDGKLLGEYDFSAQVAMGSISWGKELMNLLRSADLGLTGIAVHEENPPENTPNAERVWRVTFQHEGKNGEHFPIEFDDESAGTKRLFAIAGPWLSVAHFKLVLCADELDKSLHPSLAAELLRMLFMQALSRDGAQLIFTTHNPFLLDMTILRRDQVWFADKSPEGETFLYPLTDYRPRADESLVRGYLSGRYGAVPFIPRGLIAETENESADQTEKVLHAG